MGIRILIGLVTIVICMLIGGLMYVFDVFTLDTGLMIGYMIVSILLVLVTSWWFRRWGK